MNKYSSSSLVNGGLSEWNDWSSCSATCGPAIKTRERSCSNPVPAHGGDACVGATNEVNSCVNPKCAGKSTLVHHTHHGYHLRIVPFFF